MTNNFGVEANEQKALKKPASVEPASIRSRTAFSPSCSPTDFWSPVSFALAIASFGYMYLIRCIR